MKHVVFLILFFITSGVFAQVKFVVGSVIDSSDMVVISDVHIFDIEGKLRAVTDQYGDFRLPYYDNETFTASCIGYKSIDFPISNLLCNSVISMTQDTIKLKEIVITSLSAKEIIIRSIKQIDDLYLYDDIVISGLFNFVVKKEDSTIYSRTNSEMYVFMERPNFFPRFKSKDNPVIVNKSDDFTINIFRDFENEINSIFYFDHIIRGRGFFNLDNLGMWDFKINEYTVFDEMNVIMISANFIDQKKKVFHEGIIYINEEDYGIMKIDFKYQWKSRNYKETIIDSLWIDDLVWRGRANYIKNEGKYTLSNLEYINEKAVYEKGYWNKYRKLFEYEIICNFTSNVSIN